MKSKLINLTILAIIGLGVFFCFEYFGCKACDKSCDKKDSVAVVAPVVKTDSCAVPTSTIASKDTTKK